MTRYTITAAAALLATTSIVSAGGVERSAQSMAILFEDRNYVELSYTQVSPDISGETVTSGGFPVAGIGSGDMADTYNDIEFRYHHVLSDSLSFSLIADSPIGADVSYPDGTGYPFQTANGTIESRSLSVIFRHEMPSNVSVYGGLRMVTAEGEVFLPAIPPAAPVSYALDAEGSDEIGFVLGAAYERPDIALRVALTYHSATTHTFTGSETYDGVTVLPTEFDVTIPQSLTLEAQTGVAEGTLVFGSVRWVDWTEFAIQGDNGILDSPVLVDYDNDTFTYTLGAARRLTDEFAVLGSVSYEASTGGFSGNLGPTDGRFGLSLGARYDSGDWRLSGGVNYSWIGDAETEAGTISPLASFTDNSALGFQLRVGYSF